MTLVNQYLNTKFVKKKQPNIMIRESNSCEATFLRKTTKAKYFSIFITTRNVHPYTKRIFDNTITTYEFRYSIRNICKTRRNCNTQKAGGRKI